MNRPSALVTGGSGGIGSAIVRRLAAEGFAVTVTYASRSARADALAAEVGGVARRLDVTDRSSWAALADAHDGPLDVLVNCAGTTKPVDHGDLDGLDDDLFDHIMATNVRGAFAGVRAMRPALELAAAPVVVNISSVAGVTGVGSNVAYCASKAAMDSMTRSLGRALAPTIRVVSVSPGWVPGEYAASMPGDVLERQRAATPLQRLATPEAVGDAVWAAVAHLTYTTGAIVPVDGGRPLGVA